MQGGKSPRNEVIEFSTYAQYLKLIWNIWFLSPKNVREGFRIHRFRVHYKKYEKKFCSDCAIGTSEAAHSFFRDTHL